LFQKAVVRVQLTQREDEHSVVRVRMTQRAKK